MRSGRRLVLTRSHAAGRVLAVVAEGIRERAHAGLVRATRVVGCWAVARQRARAMSCAAVGTERGREHAESLVLATSTYLLTAPPVGLSSGLPSLARKGRTGKPGAGRWAPRRGAQLRNATKGVAESSPRSTWKHCSSVPSTGLQYHKSSIYIVSFLCALRWIRYLHERSRQFFFLHN